MHVTGIVEFVQHYRGLFKDVGSDKVYKDQGVIECLWADMGLWGSYSLLAGESAFP